MTGAELALRITLAVVGLVLALFAAGIALRGDEKGGELAAIAVLALFVLAGFVLLAAVVGLDVVRGWFGG
jgi:hypothetical protein